MNEFNHKEVKDSIIHGISNHPEEFDRLIEQIMKVAFNENQFFNDTTEDIKLLRVDLIILIYRYKLDKEMAKNANIVDDNHAT